MPVQNATQRFSSRVDTYVRFRPGYPPELLALLRSECGLTPGSVIADIGSGTGKLSELFLENGNRVFAVEPNLEMRTAAERLLAHHPGFNSIAAAAEATTLPAQSVNFVTAGQAAHWFDLGKAAAEFARILKPEGWVVLVWNDRRMETPFQKDYEEVLATYGTDYQEVRHEHTAARLPELFGHAAFQQRTLSMTQTFDYAGLEGRLLSSSYTPQPDDPHYQPMLAALRDVFEKHNSQGKVEFEYWTRVFYGQLG